MKKAVMLAAMLVMACGVFAQSKGETQVGIGGNLYASDKGKASGSKASTVINPSANVRYLMADKIGINVGLGIEKRNQGGKLGIDLGLGGRYYYYAKDKMRVNGGLDLAIGLGKGRETFDDKGKKVSMPMSLNITLAELEYWQMEGGALTGNVYYAMNGLNRGDAGSNGFGLGLGIKIRWK